MSTLMRRMGRWWTGGALFFAIGCSDATGIGIHLDGLLLTQDPVRFTEELAKIDFDNQVAVVMKDASEPTILIDRFFRPDAAGVVGLPIRPASAFTRDLPIFANASSASRQAVVDALQAVGVEAFANPTGFPIMFIEMSDAVRFDAVTVLMNHDNVDYIEAVRPWLVVWDGR